MITVYTFGPAFGLPDPSSFVTKTLVQLKMSGLSFKESTSGFRKAPKGKLPYISDDEVIISDSTFIRKHIEKKYSYNFDSHLNESEKATAWAFEKMCEDHLYFCIIDWRWMIDSNFNKGPKYFFDEVPWLFRPLIIKKVRSDLKKTLYGIGLGRHARHEIETLANNDINAIAAFLGNKAWFMGDQPSGADATIFSFVLAVMSNHFDGPIKTNALGHKNLVAYVKRGMDKWFPEIVWN